MPGTPLKTFTGSALQSVSALAVLINTPQRSPRVIAPEPDVTGIAAPVAEAAEATGKSKGSIYQEITLIRKAGYKVYKHYEKASRSHRYTLG